MNDKATLRHPSTLDAETFDFKGPLKRIQNPDPLYQTRQAAQYLGVTTGTVTNWRLRGCGPAWLKLGTGKYAAVRYRQSALEAFIQAGELADDTAV